MYKCYNGGFRYLVYLRKVVFILRKDYTAQLAYVGAKGYFSVSVSSLMIPLLSDTRCPETVSYLR